MSVYPHGELWPVQVRIAATQLEQRALTQGLAERQAERETTSGYGEPSPPRQRLAIPSAPSEDSENHTRIWRYRALAAFISLLCASAFAVLGGFIVSHGLPFFVTLATLAVFGFALVLLEAWALPEVYRWVYWRWLLVSWR